jgi:dCMP deaminase
MKWDTYYIRMAELVASKSKDPSTKVGCIIVGPDNEVRSTGYNGFPRGVSEVVEVEHTPHFLCEQEYDIREIHINQRCNCGHIDNDQNDLGLARHISEAPVGITDELIPDRWERPAKYEWIEHAERNAVYNAARVGVPLRGCTAYLNWEPYPCIECAKALVQAGIARVVGPDREFPNHKKAENPDEDQWKSGDQWKFGRSQQIMDEAGVEYVRVPWDASKDFA